MQPFYFGRSDAQLFGVYHAPEARNARSGAIVLCQPLGHEYLRAHRAFRNLAVALAGHGFHVLRFDYLGCGDSSGDPERTTIAQCLADLEAAIGELKDMSGATRVTLIGLRIGATLAALVAGRRPDVDRVVLWDPVVDGGEYVRELKALQSAWLEDRLGPGVTAAATDDELLGFSLTEASRREIGGLKMPPPPSSRLRALSLFVSDDRAPYRALRDEIAAVRPNLTYAVVPGAGEWDRVDQVHQILLPHAMVRAITADVAGVTH